MLCVPGRLHQAEHVVEVCRLSETGLDRVAVIALPVARIVDSRLADQLGRAIVVDRYSNPASAIRHLDLVAIAPVALGELQVIMDNEQIHVVDEVEVSPPREVVRLDDAHSHDVGVRRATKNLRVTCWQRSYLPLSMMCSVMARSTPS